MATLKEGQLVRIISKEALRKSDDLFGIARYLLEEGGDFNYFKDNPLYTIYSVHYYGNLQPHEDCCRIVPIGCTLNKSRKTNRVLKSCLMPISPKPIL